MFQKEAVKRLLGALFSDPWFVPVALLAVIFAVAAQHQLLQMGLNVEQGAAAFASAGMFVRLRYLQGRLGSWLIGLSILRKLKPIEDEGPVGDRQTWSDMLAHLKYVARSPSFPGYQKLAEYNEFTEYLVSTSRQTAPTRKRLPTLNEAESGEAHTPEPPTLGQRIEDESEEELNRRAAEEDAATEHQDALAKKKKPGRRPPPPSGPR